MLERARVDREGRASIGPDQDHAVVRADLQVDRLARLEPLARVLERVDVNPDVGHCSVMVEDWGGEGQAQRLVGDRSARGLLNWALARAEGPQRFEAEGVRALHTTAQILWA